MPLFGLDLELLFLIRHFKRIFVKRPFFIIAKQLFELVLIFRANVISTVKSASAKEVVNNTYGYLKTDLTVLKEISQVGMPIELPEYLSYREHSDAFRLKHDGKIFITLRSWIT